MSDTESREILEQKREVLTTAKQTSRAEKKALDAEKKAQKDEAAALAAREKELKEEKREFEKRKAATKKEYKQKMKAIRASMPPLSQRIDTTYLWLVLMAPLASFCARNLTSVNYVVDVDYYHLPNIFGSILLGYVASHRRKFLRISSGCANSLSVGLAGTMTWFSTWILVLLQNFEDDHYPEMFLTLFYGFADCILGIALGVTIAEFVHLLSRPMNRQNRDEDGLDGDTTGKLASSESQRSISTNQAVHSVEMANQRPETVSRTRKSKKRHHHGRLGAIMELANKIEDKQKASDARKRAKEAKKEAKKKKKTGSVQKELDNVSPLGEEQAFAPADQVTDENVFADATSLEPWPRIKVPFSTKLHLLIIVVVVGASVLFVDLSNFKDQVVLHSWSVYAGELVAAYFAAVIRYVICRYVNRPIFPLGTFIVNVFSVALLVYLDSTRAYPDELENSFKIILFNSFGPALSSLSDFGMELRELGPVVSMIYGISSVVGGIVVAKFINGFASVTGHVAIPPV